MKLGAIFPQLEIGVDHGAIREYAQAVEAIGYDHLVAFDHVLGADPNYYRGWDRPYSNKDMFHEPFVLFGFLAAVTTRLELVTSIIIMPQRQTVLAAKQAAEVDILSGGRLRLGIGTGWNEVEYEGLGQDFHTRGQRSEEQIALLRALWDQPTVTFHGRWDKVTAAGLNPLPLQRPIPIWLGGSAEPVLRRVGHLADGWFPQFNPDNKDGLEQLERVRSYARDAGRNPSSIGIEARISLANTTPDDWSSMAETWRGLGATHLAVSTMRANLGALDQHITALRQFYEAVTC